MKYTVHFLITCFISTGALLGATKAHNPWPHFMVMGIIWLLFARRIAEKNKRRSDEEKFRANMRSKINTKE